MLCLPVHSTSSSAQICLPSAAAAEIAGVQARDLPHWGSPGRGLPAQGAWVFLKQPWLCRPLGKMGSESLSCKLEHLSPHSELVAAGSIPLS